MIKCPPDDIPVCAPADSADREAKRICGCSFPHYLVNPDGGGPFLGKCFPNPAGGAPVCGTWDAKRRLTLGHDGRVIVNERGEIQ
jgi:hypothetical protein